MTHEINLAVLLKTLKRYWWKIMIVTLVIMIAAACFTMLLIPKKYSSTIEIYIINSNSTSDYTTTSLLGASSYLVNDYVAIIKGDTIMNKVCENLNGTEKVGAITPAELRSKIKTSSSPDSSIFKLSVVDTNPERAFAIVTEIAKIAPTEVTNIVKAGTEINQRDTIANYIKNAMTAFGVAHPEKGVPTTQNITDYLNDKKIGFDRQDCISINIQPQAAPKSPDSPNVPVYTLLAGFAAAVVSYAIFLLVELSSAVITTEDDVKKLLEQPLIGTIPHWSSGTGAKN